MQFGGNRCGIWPIELKTGVSQPVYVNGIARTAGSEPSAASMEYFSVASQAAPGILESDFNTSRKAFGICRRVQQIANKQQRNGRRIGRVHLFERIPVTSRSKDARARTCVDSRGWREEPASVEFEFAGIDGLDPLSGGDQYRSPRGAGTGPIRTLARWELKFLEAGEVHGYYLFTQNRFNLDRIRFASFSISSVLRISETEMTNWSFFSSSACSASASFTISRASSRDFW
jgi:hypothetical protein